MAKGNKYDLRTKRNLSLSYRDLDSIFFAIDLSLEVQQDGLDCCRYEESMRAKRLKSNIKSLMSAKKRIEKQLKDQWK